MIKFCGENKGIPIIGLGLSEENVRRLKEGMPILLNTEEVEKLFGKRAQVLIFYGQTEESMVEELQKIGILPEGIQYSPPNLGSG